MSRHSPQSPSVADADTEWMPNATITLGALQQRMHEFVASRGWYAADSPKPQSVRNLTVSLALEAAELLECFQWSDDVNRIRLADELADVVLYALQISNVADLDLGEALQNKLAFNRDRDWDVAIAEQAS